MLEIILVQGFCSLKTEITQFPDGLHLNVSKNQFELIFAE